MKVLFEMEEQMDKKDELILIFCSREICYSSGNFFAHQIAAAFEEMGFRVEVCEFTKDDDFDERLTPYIGKKYRLILDFNSLLPRLAMDDGTPFIDQLDGPFYDYILDHPLFHYNGLCSKGRDFHAIVLDEAQREYVRRYHPQLQSVHMLTLGATKALFCGEKKAPEHILFMGTYDKPEAVYEMVELAPDPIQVIMKDIIERRIAEPTLPMEEAFSQYLQEHSMEPDGIARGLSGMKDEKFALFMNTMYAADAFIRDYFRKAALDELISKKIPVKLIGEGWEKYVGPNEAYVTREKGVRFDLSFEKIAREQILLNVSPIFNRGVHDRVIAGLANHTAVLTDENPYLQTHFSNRENIGMYSLKKIATLSEMAGELMENQVLREQIQKQGYEEFCEKYTWQTRAAQILSWSAKSKF